MIFYLKFLPMLGSDSMLCQWSCQGQCFLP